MADDESGYLRTDIEANRRVSKPLVSQTVITDSRWYRIGLVWDGIYRSLYVGDELVTIDTADQPNMKSVGGGLIIGAGQGLEPGSFWSGMIDDVRIYDRAVTP